MSDSLLITGAAGQLGRIVIDELLASGKVDPASIVVTTRDPAKLSGYAAKGITVRKADFDDPASLDAAFAGVGKMLIISTDALDQPGRRLRQHLAAVTAAAKAGAAHILYTSMPQPDDSLVLFAPDHLGTENAIRESGIPYTILRNGWYAENLLSALPQVLASGHWYTSTGTGRIAHALRADIGRAVAGALLEAGHESRTYTLTGPNAQTTDEIAAAVSAAAGRKIEVVHVTDEQLAAGMKAVGVPEPLIPLLVSFDANTREGKIAMVTGDVEALGGRKPEPLETFLAANRAALSA